MMFDNALWKASFTSMASNTNAAIMVPRIKAVFVRRDNLLPINPPGILERSPRCSRHRRIDEADINTPVAVDQCDVNCLEEAVRSFTAIRTRCLSSRADVTFLRPLPVFRVVKCRLVSCFQTRITVEPFRSARAAIAQQKNLPLR
ncbi:uncharacterized protein TNCV_2209851 [Trichonephila clavipes]|nr:uncharacterized protein TNCV_2209851 [Trichonephila clavipes]